MNYIIVKTDYKKYGIVYLNESPKSVNKVHFSRREDDFDEVAASRLSVVNRNDITDKDVFNANYWKRYLNDRSMYIPITDQWKYEKCYDTVYSEEIKEHIKALAKFIELANKGKLLEKMFC